MAGRGRRNKVCGWTRTPRSGWLSSLSRRKSELGAAVSLATDSKFEPRSHLTEGFLGCEEESARAENDSEW